MRPIFVFILIASISCSFVHSSQFILESSREIKVNEPIFLNQTNTLIFKADGNLAFMNLFYQNYNNRKKLEEKIDSVDFTPYKSFIHVFNSKKDDSYVIFWETEYELIPYTIAYYLFNNNLSTIGAIEVANNCEGCENHSFPYEDLLITKIDNRLEIVFEENVIYKIGATDEKVIKPNCLKYVFDIQTQKLKISTHL